MFNIVVEFLHLVYKIINLWFNFVFVILWIISSIYIPALLLIGLVGLIKYSSICRHNKLLHFFNEINDSDKNNCKFFYHQKTILDLQSYGPIIKKIIWGSNFMNVYSSYYPDKTMNREKIKKMLSLHLFDIVDSNMIDESVISFHKTINTLTNKICKTYILDDSNQSDPVNPSDLSDLVINDSVINIIKRYLMYKSLWFKMLKYGFRYHDINKSVRLWYHKNRSDNISNVKLIIIDSELELKDFDKINNKNDVIIEIRGFSCYSELHDYLTFGIFDKFDTTFADVTNGIGKCIDFIKKKNTNANIDIKSKNLATIFVPCILDDHHELIKNIDVTNPMFYPWMYNDMFKIIRSNKSYQNHHILCMMHKRTMFKTYIRTLSKMKISGVLSNKMHVTLPIDAEELKMILTVYGNVKVRSFEMINDKKIKLNLDLTESEILDNDYRMIIE